MLQTTHHCPESAFPGASASGTSDWMMSSRMACANWRYAAVVCEVSPPLAFAADSIPSRSAT
jgi:hypothetical protein